MNRRIKLYILIIGVILIAFGPERCWAEYDVIDITKPFLRKIPLAVPLFKNVNETAEEKQLSETAADFLSDTLEFTGYFKILDRGSFLFNPERSGVTLATINFQNWTVVGAELLITGFYEAKNDRISVELRLFDTFKARRVIGKNGLRPVSVMQVPIYDEDFFKTALLGIAHRGRLGVEQAIAVPSVAVGVMTAQAKAIGALQVAGLHLVHGF